MASQSRPEPDLQGVTRLISSDQLLLRQVLLAAFCRRRRSLPRSFTRLPLRQDVQHDHTVFLLLVQSVLSRCALMQYHIFHRYPLSNFTFGTKDAQHEEDPSVAARLQRLENVRSTRSSEKMRSAQYKTDLTEEMFLPRIMKISE